MVVLKKSFPTRLLKGGDMCMSRGVFKLLWFCMFLGWGFVLLCYPVDMAHVLPLLPFLSRFIPGAFLLIKTKMDKIQPNSLGYNY